jgi:hypothetical protein
MKKIVLLIAVFFAFNQMNAQTKVIKTNPIGMVFGIFNASYEFTTSDTNSVEVGAAYINILGVSGYSIEGRYKFYFGDKALRGVYAAPFASYSGVTDGENNYGFPTLGAVGGYQFIFGDGDAGFALDLYAGLRYNMMPDSAGTTFGNGVGATFGLAIGYGF